MEYFCRATAESHRSRESATNKDIVRWRQHPSRARLFFLKAGPGQGKSTVTQYLCQLQRAALILAPEGVPAAPKMKELAEDIQEAAQRAGHWPSHPRIPIYIELKEYAKWISEQHEGKDPIGVLTYIAHSIGYRVQQRVEVGLLRRAFKQYRWLVIFDGLDEVPQDRRDTVAREVQELIAEAEAEPDIDAFFACTSRPQGYAGQFSDLDGPTLELVSLSPEQALLCAQPMLGIARTPQQREEALSLLREALQTGAVRELMTSPLQAHIMAILVRDGERPPDRRWKLYERFYGVIYQREKNRRLTDARLHELLCKHEKLLRAVHEGLGFVLQVRSETSEGAQASLERGQFRALVQRIVCEYVEQGAEGIVDTVMDATIERLVLVSTPDSGGQVRFDIRPLQEFFAAEYLYQGVDAESLRERLSVLAGDSHWYEVLHFLLSALFESNRSTEISVAMEVLVQLDQGGSFEEHELAQRDGRGARLLVRLLRDGVLEPSFAQRRRIRPCLEASFDAIASEFNTPHAHLHPQSMYFLIDLLLQRLEESDFRISIGAAVGLGGILSEQDARFPRFQKRMASASLGYRAAMLSMVSNNLSYSSAGNADIAEESEAVGAELTATVDTEMGKGTATDAETSALKDWMVSLAADMLNDPDWYKLPRKTIFDAIEVLHAATPSQRGKGKVKELLGELAEDLIRLLGSQEESAPDYPHSGCWELKTSFGEIDLYRAFPSESDENLISLAEALGLVPIRCTGLFALLGKAIHFAATLKRRALINLLQELGTTGWDGFDFLSSYFNKSLPEFPNQITPGEMIVRLEPITDDEFVHQWQNHRIAGYNCEYRWRSYTVPGKAESIQMNDLEKIAKYTSTCAVSIWLSPMQDHLNVFLVDNPNFVSRQIEPPIFGSDVTELIYPLVQEHIYKLVIYPDLWGLIWATLGDRSLDLRQRLCRSLGGAALRLSTQTSRIYPFKLALPAELPMLVPICSAVLSDAWIRRHRTHRKQYESGRSYSDLISQYVDDLALLLRCAQNQAATPAQRSAAVLLAALHPGGGGRILQAQGELLTSCATDLGCAAVPLFVGICVDVLEAETGSEMRALLSALLRVTADRFETRQPIDELLTLWRARSHSPATRADVLRAWVSVPELSTMSRSR